MDNKAHIVDLRNIDKTQVRFFGGKGAGLGELTRVVASDGAPIRVPYGFCISTEAFEKIIKETYGITALLDQLSMLKVEDRQSIRQVSGEIRQLIEEAVIPNEIREEIVRHIRALDDKGSFAIRSSATAEDLPTASFAGQQDTYLNVVGINSVLNHVSKCWASLFTERAVIYRMQNEFDHRKVQLAVVVQKMIHPEVAGILFTADPVTSNRKVLSIDASFGLGEALVSGRVNPDVYKVQNGTIIDKKLSSKKLAVYPSDNGGTVEREISVAQRDRQALTDEQILQLERLARTIEQYFGSPQDIEWCLADGIFYIVQSRPITTLYPIPSADDNENHVYVSVGHQQMMTDAMKPLGLSFYLLMTSAPMRKAGGRLFVDVTQMLATTSGRHTLINVLGKSDPLIRDALTTIIERDGFIRLSPGENGDKGPENKSVADQNNKTPTHRDYQVQLEYDPAIVPDLIKRSEASLKELKLTIQTKSGSDLIDFILEDISSFKKSSADSKSFAVIMTGMNASAWINEKMNEWLGEKNAADALSQSISNNITSEMGMALLDVADVIRPYPKVVEYLQHANDDKFFDGLQNLDGGQQTRDAIDAFLDKYGMRCAGEIDITKPRWKEKPATLVPLILSSVKNVSPGASQRRFEQGRQEALRKEEDLLARLRQLPDGEQKAEETKRMVWLIRNYSGYREYPKYSIVNRYFVYKQALLREAERLVAENVIAEKEDIFYLSFEELRELITTRSKINAGIIRARKEEYKSFEKLFPPRVITSEGEIITGNYKHENLPANAIAGLAVSSGVIEGRARVVLNMADADMKDGDILVTSFTDPSWAPLFVSIKGLVTEVGGLMTHGAVIAREYGLPAVVGVENATRLIKDGQRIKVNGTDGFVELL